MHLQRTFDVPDAVAQVDYPRALQPVHWFPVFADADVGPVVDVRVSQALIGFGKFYRHDLEELAYIVLDVGIRIGIDIVPAA